MTKKNTLFTLALAYLIALVGCQLEEVPSPEESQENDPNADWVCGEDWVDTRDGKSYATVNINGTCFFAENLDFDIVGDFVGTGNENCIPGARYYDSSVAQEACPDGWKIPSETDLLNTFGSFDTPPSPTVPQLVVGGSTGLNIQFGGLLENDACFDVACCAIFVATSASGNQIKWWMIDTGLDGPTFDDDFSHLSATELINPFSSGNVKLNVRCIKE